MRGAVTPKAQRILRADQEGAAKLFSLVKYCAKTYIHYRAPSAFVQNTLKSSDYIKKRVIFRCHQ